LTGAVAIVSLAVVLVAAINAYAHTVESRTMRALVAAEMRIAALDASVSEAARLLRDERREVVARWEAYEARVNLAEQQIKGLVMKVR
jgi:hypothetical protein